MSIEIHSIESSNVFEIKCKRLYHTIKLTATCPKCGAKVTKRLHIDSYLSYPLIGRPFSIDFCHEFGKDDDWEEHEFEFQIVLNFTLEVAKK